MKKKILGIAIAIVMLFAVAGLAACELNNPTLAEYQATARVDLTNYAESRGQGNFTTENWAVIQGHVTTGKAAIDAANNKPAVRTARDNAKATVRAVETNGNNISFNITEDAFAIEDAWDISLLELIRTQSELQQLIIEQGLILDAEEFDSAFFANYALVVIHFSESGGSMNSAYINTVKAREGVLEIYRTRYRLNHYGAILHSIIIEIAQIDIVGIDEVKVIIREVTNYDYQ